MINFSAALSTWPPSSSPLLNGKGESVIFSSLTIGLFPNRDKAGDAVCNAAGMKVTAAERLQLLEEFMLTEKRSKTYQRKYKDFLKIKIT
ncbi:hypothetical protein Tco_0386424 [Tanacetum coccineum]